MRSLTEIKGDDALDMVADLLEPITELMSDERVKTAYYSKNLASAVKVCIKEHKNAVKLILAVMNEEDPATYEPSVVDMPKLAYQLLTDEALQDLFTFPNQPSKENTFGAVSESTEGEE